MANPRIGRLLAGFAALLLPSPALASAVIKIKLDVADQFLGLFAIGIFMTLMLSWR